MSERSTLIHYTEKGLNEDWYALVCDPVSERVFVKHSWSHRKGRGFENLEIEISLADFLSRTGDAQTKLLALIATLVPTPSLS